MARILFVIPSADSKFRDIALGIGYLAAVAREQNHEIQIFDCNVSYGTMRKLEKNLRDFRPDFVGLTSLTSNYHRAVNIINYIRKYHPQIQVIMGGPHVSFAYEEPLLNHGVDYVIRFEGEETLCELLDVITEGRDVEKVKGIAYCDKGKIRVTPPRPPLSNLDALPFPARDLFDVANYPVKERITMLTSRGCVNHCAFCASTQVHKKYRQRSPGNLIEEIEMILHQYGSQLIQFVDDTFAADRKRIEDLCYRIMDRDLTFKWACEMRVNEADPDLLDLMKEAGCLGIFYGLESLTQSVLERVHKNTTVEQNHAAVQRTTERGMLTSVSFVIGLPGETAESFRKTIKFTENYDIFEVVFSALVPFPGSAIAQSPHEYGITILHHEWEKYTAHYIVAHSDTMSVETIQELRKEALRTFYKKNWDKMSVVKIPNPEGEIRGYHWVMNRITGKRFVFSEMGSLIWNTLDGEQPISHVIQRVQDKTGIRDEAILWDIINFLMQMDTSNLIRINHHDLKTRIEREVKTYDLH